MKLVLVIDGAEYPASLQHIGGKGNRIGVTLARETFLQVLDSIQARAKPPKAVIQEYVGVDFSSGFLDDDLIWVKAQDFVVEGQWLNLYNILGDCRMTVGTMGEKQTMKLQVKSLRMPISSMRTVIRTTTNPLGA